MSTVFATDDVPSITASEGIAADDTMVVYNASSGRVVKATAAQILGGATGVVDTTATTLTVTAASHSGKTVTISSAAPIAVTLPQATGTGNVYRFNVLVAATATSHTIKVANSTDVVAGVVHVMTSATSTNVAAIVAAFRTSATSDTVTLNGTTLGGVAGDWVEIVDIKTGIFQVHGTTQATGSYATPFSAAVP